MAASDDKRVQDWLARVGDLRQYAKGGQRSPRPIATLSIGECGILQVCMQGLDTADDCCNAICQ